MINIDFHFNGIEFYSVVSNACPCIGATVHIPESDWRFIDDATSPVFLVKSIEFCYFQGNHRVNVSLALPEVAA